MMIATSLILIGIGIGSVKVGEAWEEANVIHVGGKVLCQDCTKGWNDWVNGSNPIKGTASSLPFPFPFPFHVSQLPINYHT